MSNRAQIAYAHAVENLRKFCEDNTDLDFRVLSDRYPIRFVFEPCAQLNMFTPADVDDNGEVRSIIVTVGLSTAIKSTMNFHVPAAVLKKIIKLSEKAGELYYQAYREEADETEKEGEAV